MPSDQVGPGARTAEAVEARRAEHHRHEHERPANVLCAREPVKGQRIAIRAVTRDERRHASEQAERDGEALTVPRPGVAPVHRHPGQRPVRVQGRRHSRVSRGYAASGCASSSATNAKSAAAAGYLPQRPDHSSTGRASRPPSSTSQTVASAMARQGLRTLHTFPNRIERSGIPSQKTTYTNVGVKLSERDRRAEQRSREGQHEEPDGRPSRARSARRARARARLIHAGAGVHRRAPPAAAGCQRKQQQDERDDEDDDRAEEEVGRRNREVADDPDPVREEPHGSTVMSAICTPRSSSSTSNRPGMRRAEAAGEPDSPARRRA